MAAPFSGSQSLFPAVRPGISKDYLPALPRYSAAQWTLGHGSVIWTIWPAVLVHTIFAAIVVVVSEETSLKLKIPNVMLTVLGVVIGFVISYRAISGYERYWMGRTIWTDIMKNARTMSRLVHIHVPARLSPKTKDESERSSQELLRVMSEKRMALDLIKGFCIALKHHLRGELGIYYEDLYDLVHPLHEHGYNDDMPILSNPSHDITESPSVCPKEPSAGLSTAPRELDYGSSQTKPLSARPSCSPPSESQPLLPSEGPSDQTDMEKAQTQLIPFGIGNFFTKLFHPKVVVQSIGGSHLNKSHRWQGPLQPKFGKPKGAPRITGSGENLPLEILRCLSEWCSVLEDRNTTPGSSLGSIVGCIALFEASLTSLEMILSTPLPFVYAAHIRQTVWIYLFFLPFQLVSDFGYFTILGVAIAAFIYLGFLAAGVEIEQPFGYDENDLDLDLFCRDVISDEIEVLKRNACPNAYLGPSQLK